MKSDRHAPAAGPAKEVCTVILDKIALALSIIGGLNWGCIGLFNFDLVAFISGGAGTWFARIIYTVVGLAALWCLTRFFGPGANPRHGHA